MTSEKRAFILGMVTAFSECVAGGCKRLALSPPLMPEEYARIAPEACLLVERHGLIHHHETNPELPEGERSVEGVRARLCQIAAEVLGSPSYLSGFARAGVQEEQALELLALCQGCLGDLDGFLSAPEHAVVYGPMLRETDSCLEVAQKNIANVYHNPVARMDWGESEDD